MTQIETIFHILKSSFLPVTTEKEVQGDMENAFLFHDLKHEREYRLDNKNIVDFFVDGIAIEVKIKGSKKDIYRQCERYCQFDEVKSLILVTSKSMGFPEEINGKSCYYFSLGMNLL